MRFERSLTAGEQVEVDLHPHWHQLLGSILALPITVGLASYFFFIVPHGAVRRPLRYLILVAALIVLVWWVLRPFVKWLATRYIVTNRRIVIRDGVVRRRGRDIPLTRLNDVSFDSGLIERMFRCGTLRIESAGDHGQIALSDMPHVEWVQHTIYELTEEETARQRY